MLPQAPSSSFHGVKKLFRLDVMQPFKNIEVYGWAALPNIPSHGPAHFAALKKRFVLMLCRLSPTIKWSAGRVPPNTVEFISRCWKKFSPGWYEPFQKHSNLWLGRAPQHLFPRPSSFRGVEAFFRLVVMQTFNNVQIIGSSCSPKHGPAHFTMLKNNFASVLCRLSTTFKKTVGSAITNTVQYYSRR